MQKIIYMSELSDYSDCLDKKVVDYIACGQTETFESFESFDLIAFDWYDLYRTDLQPAQILIYFDREDLFFICENEFSYSIATQLYIKDESNEHALFLFFRNLFEGSTAHIEQLDAKIAELDDEVIEGTAKALRERIIALRNEIMRIKKYYEQLSFLFDEICENDNDLFTVGGLKYFEILRNRAVRLVAQTMNLREYVTQVRESYQAQIGIEQNNVMKVFTLVTSIFLPLSLIAGWYGMNVQMPEFTWRYGYLVVIAISVVTCVVWYLAFKKKKWFK